MKKYLLIITIALFLPAVAFCQRPSFEIYDENDNYYPRVASVYISPITESKVTVTATITDVSGIYSAAIVIKDSDGVIVPNPSATLQLFGSYYGTLVDVSGYEDGTYTIGFRVADNLGYSNPDDVYSNMGYFIIGQVFGCSPTDPAAVLRLCVGISNSNPNQISSFTVNPSVITVGDLVTLTASIYSNTAGQTIYFRDNNTNIVIGSATTNYSGTATYTYTPAFSGEHVLEAVFKGNDSLNLSPSYKTATLTISGLCQTSGSATLCVQTPAPSNFPTINTFSLSSYNISIGSEVTLTATLFSATPDQIIYFRDRVSATIIGSAITNSSGTATYTYTPAFSGPHTLEAIFQGNSFLNLSPSYKTATLTISGMCQDSNSATLCVQTPIVSNATMSSFVLSSSSVIAEATITLTANMSSGLPGLVITFYDTTAGVTIGSVTTNSSGVAVIDYTIPTATPTSTHTMTATCKNNGQSRTAPLNITALLLVSTLTVSPTAVTAGETVTITATTAPVTSGTTITFYDTTAGTTLGSVVTNASGVATINYTIPTNTTTAIHTLTATCVSSGRSNTVMLDISGLCKTSGSATLCINGVPAPSNPSTINIFSLSSSSISVGTAVTMTATLSSAVADQTIYFRDNNTDTVIGSATTNSSGTATYTYTPAFSGPHTLEAVFKGNGSNLSPSYKTATLTISGLCQTSGATSLCIQTPTIANPKP